MSSLKSWLGRVTKSSRKVTPSPRRAAWKPTVEALEQREVLSGISYVNQLLTVTGGAGNDTIAVTRIGNNVQATLNGTTQTFSLGGVKDVVINPGSGSNTVSVNGLLNVPVSVTGAAGANDAVFIELASNNPAITQGSVSVNYGAGSKATLDVKDYSAALGQYVTITKNAITMQAPAGGLGGPGATDAKVSYSGNITALEVDGGNGNTFTVQSTLAATPLTIDAGTGFNWVNIGGTGAQIYGSRGGSLSAIAGTVHVNDASGKTSLNVDDSGGSDNQRVTVTSSSVAFAGGPTVDYQGNVTSLSIFAPDDLTDKTVFTVQSVASTTTLDLWGNSKYQVTGAAANKAQQYHYYYLT